MQESIDLLVGDVFLGAACIAYYGAFPGSFRQELLVGWVEQCKKLGIPVSHDCTLRGVLASPVQVIGFAHAAVAPVAQVLMRLPVHQHSSRSVSMSAIF